jgi:flagellar secretion chaperone FliS
MAIPSLHRYLDDSVTTASPGRLLVMLYDRLCLDLERAAVAVADGDRERAGTALLHAQDILLELRGTLRLDAWPGAQGLADVYSFLLSELLRANVRQDGALVAACLAVVTPLRDTWREVVDRGLDTSATPSAGLGGVA